ncbi:unnamed protein product [Spirodela intermedia]|uniref:Uncharacterized protein n=1 Tax=Spirodela intermedia TaxID=51605 RepID=A0A7I8IJE4_SPIIN|nr:unnamed protein product [Spirodela intermedia]CAA6657085.1 unnamed protein product [Spirodela intermedia]
MGSVRHPFHVTSGHWLRGKEWSYTGKGTCLQIRRGKRTIFYVRIIKWNSIFV